MDACAADSSNFAPGLCTYKARDSAWRVTGKTQLQAPVVRDVTWDAETEGSTTGQTRAWW